MKNKNFNIDLETTCKVYKVTSAAKIQIINNFYCLLQFTSNNIDWINKSIGKFVIKNCFQHTYSLSFVVSFYFYKVIASIYTKTRQNEYLIKFHIQRIYLSVVSMCKYLLIYRNKYIVLSFMLKARLLRNLNFIELFSVSLFDLKLVNFTSQPNRVFNFFFFYWFPGNI